MLEGISQVLFVVDEFTEEKWSTVEQAKELKLPPPTIELFKRLGYI